MGLTSEEWDGFHQELDPEELEDAAEAIAEMAEQRAYARAHKPDSRQTSQTEAVGE